MSYLAVKNGASLFSLEIMMINGRGLSPFLLRLCVRILWAAVGVMLVAGSAFAACNTTHTLVAGTPASLVGTPFSACTISGSTITCTQDVSVGNNTCVVTTSPSLTIDMGAKKLKFGNSGTLGSSSNPINVTTTGKIQAGNGFTGYGNLTGSEIEFGNSTTVTGICSPSQPECVAFSLTKTASAATIPANTNYTYTLLASNTTSSTYSAVVVTDNLTAAGLTFVSCTTAAGTCTYASGSVSWSIGTVAANTSKTATLTVRAASAGTITNTITANTAGTPTAVSTVQIYSPLADWRMDEASWNGTTGEVTDSTGNGHNGRAQIANGATGVPTTLSASPAYTSGSQSTCGYGDFDRAAGPARSYSYVELSGLPTLPASFTFAAWIKSTNASQSGQRILVRDDAGDGWGFSLGDPGQAKVRFFNRNIANSGAVTGDGSNPGCGATTFCLDTAAVITSNNWFFVAVAINTTAKTITHYVYNAAGTLVSNTSGSFSGTWKDGTGLASIGGESSASAEGVGPSFHFQGNIDEVQIYSGVLSQSDLNILRTRTRTCGGTPPPVPANFNCVESGADAATGHLYTKLAGTGFSFDVVALKTDGSVETTYASATNKNVTVELVDGSGATACAARTAISPAVSQTLAFTTLNQPTEQGRKAAASMTVNKAYGDLRCRVTDANQSPSIVGCSADSFAVRPLSFNSVTSTGSADGDNAGASDSASTVVKAGASFSLTADTGIVGYGGLPKVNKDKIEWPNVPAGGRAAPGVGTLSGAFSTAANAATGNGATGAAFTYTDVGYFRFKVEGVYDDTFTAQSADTTNSDCTDDFSNALVGGKYGCKFGNTAVSNHFGRFIPAGFVVSVVSIVPRSDIAACSASSFTYLGEPIQATGATLTAKATGGLVTTQNYAGVFAKLDLASVAGNVTNLGLGAQQGVNPNFTNFYSAVAASNRLIVAYGSTSFTDKYLVSDADPKCVGAEKVKWCLGQSVMSLDLTIGRAGVPDGPFTGVVLGISPTDSDGVKMNTLDFQRNYSGSGVVVGDGKTIATLAGNELRFGRLKLFNVFGTDRTDLAIPVQAQYWSGLTWIKNAADSCTPIAKNSVALSDALSVNNKVSADVTLSGGGANIVLTCPYATCPLATKPASPLTGTVGVCVDLGANPGTGVVCSATSSAALSYLQSLWPPGSSYNNDPWATATFGVYSPETKKTVHVRELY